MESKSAYRNIAQGLFVCETKLKLPAYELPVRSTAIKTRDGQVIVISPLNPKKCDYGSLRRIGKVTHIVAPNSFHNLFAAGAKAELPEATLWAAPLLPGKRPEIPWEAVIGREQWPFAGELDWVFMDGAPGWGEVVFYHRDSKTLIATDLFFNLKNVSGLRGRMLFGLMGTRNRFAMSRLVKLFLKNKTAYAKSLSTLMSWDFDRVVVAHGEILESGGWRMAAEAIGDRLGLGFAVVEHKGDHGDATV